MPRAQREGGFRNALSVNPDMATRHDSCCQPTGLEEPRVPNPLIQSLRVAHATNPFCFLEQIGSRTDLPELSFRMMSLHRP